MIERNYDHFNPPLIDIATLGIHQGFPVAYGSEKLVYKSESKGQVMAVKIFRDKNEGTLEIQNKEKLSICEFNLYKSFKYTPIGIHIPVAHDLVIDSNRSIIGFTTTWIDGDFVMHIDDDDKRPKETDVDLLEANLFAASELGIYISSDAFSENNLLLDQNRLWFCELSTEEVNNLEELKRYHKILKRTMNEIREYC